MYLNHPQSGGREGESERESERERRGGFIAEESAIVSHQKHTPCHSVEQRPLRDATFYRTQPRHSQTLKLSRDAEVGILRVLIAEPEEYQIPAETKEGMISKTITTFKLSTKCTLFQQKKFNF